jgi:hypothetical protein
MPRLPDFPLSAYPSSRAYSSSITRSSSFLKRGAGSRSACPGGKSLFVQACTERSECVPMAPLWSYVRAWWERVSSLYSTTCCVPRSLS